MADCVWLLFGRQSVCAATAEWMTLHMKIPPVSALQASLRIALRADAWAETRAETFSDECVDALYTGLALVVADILHARIAPLVASLHRAKQTDERAFEADSLLCAHLRYGGCCLVDSRGWIYQ